MSSDDETFDVATDCGPGWARVALVGSAGSEVLVVFPFLYDELKEPDAQKLATVEAGEARLRRALLALIKSNWSTGTQ